MKYINTFLAGIVLTLSNNAMAYIPDRCDWQDCEAMARGESGNGASVLIILIVIGLIVYTKK